MCCWVCSYLPQFSSWNCAPGLTKNAVSKLLCTEFANKEEEQYTIGGFSFNYAYDKLTINCEGLYCSLKCKLSPLIVILLLNRPPLPCSSFPSLFKLEAEQTGLFSRAGPTAVDYARPPPIALYAPPAPVPLPPFSLSTPFQSYGASGIRVIIFSLLR